MLDLDGDGLELKRASGSILFDHNADTIRTGTGWIDADDGILVRDLNGNGSIDSGRELFGIDTVKSDGRNAVNGFDALADLDANADGQLNAADLAWGSLQIWRDLDQDGITDAGELSGLDTLGISRIGVNGSASNATGGAQAGTTVNGNLIAQSASFTREVDGVQVNRTVGAIDLESNAFYREFTVAVPLTEQARSLPQMQGSGRARDLAEAVSLSPTLGTSLSAFSSATTRDAQRALLDDLLTQWAQGSDFWQSLETSLDGNVKISGLPAGMTEAQYRNLVGVLEVFNGERFYSTGANGIAMTAGTTKTTTTDAASNVTRAGYGIAPPAAQLALLQQSYDALKESIYSALVLQTRLEPYLDAIELTIDENGLRFDTTALAGLLDQRRTVSERDAFSDLVELNRFAQPTLQAVGFAGLETLRGWVEALPAGSALRTELAALNVYAGATTSGTAKSDIYLGDANGNSFSGGAGDDMADGDAGNDALNGGEGNDSLFGKAGNDSLYGDAGDDTIDGGVGNDYLYGGAGSDLYRFARGWGQDAVSNYDTSIGKTDAIEFAEGIAASDIVATRSGDDLILSLRGSTDRVTVSSCFYTDGVSGYKIEEIRFADGTRWDMTQLKQMVQQGTEGNDSLQGYAVADTLSGGAGNDYIRGWAGNDTLDGGAGNDTLFGDDGDDRLTGGAGEDSLSGGNGSDSLLGGDGNDNLYGEAGDDTLDGGAGNDCLNGGAGSDLYRFARGWGQDAVSNYDTSIGKTDAIEFAEGIAASDIVATRSGDDLVLSLRGSTDRVTVSSCFYTDGVSGYKIEEIRFADGTRWDMVQLKQMVQQGTDGNDSLQGYAVADTLSGGAGNDSIRGWAGNDTLDGGAGNDTLVGDEGDDALGGGTGDDTLYGGNGSDSLLGGDGNDSLYGEAGDDTLDGGAGNDYLYGGAGSDLYRFARGWGQDVINNYDTSIGKTDAIEFAEGIAASDIVATRSGDDLILSLRGSTDRVTVSSCFYTDGVSGYKIEEIRFADGTRWDMVQLKQMVQQGTDGNDSLQGYAVADTLSGGAGNDNIRGWAGNDTLDGGAGNDTLVGDEGDDALGGGTGDDTLYGGNGSDSLLGGDGNDSLYGEAGDDALDGGAGNDYVNGGAGSDLYRFARGWGQDVINNYDTSIGKTDAIEFAEGIAASDIVATRSGDDLILSLRSSTDRVSVSACFYTDGVSGYKIEEIRFADGTRWDMTQLKQMVQQGTDGNDSLQGYAIADTLSGGAGNDNIRGWAGNDTLDGGAGNDTLVGDEGDDRLTGGAGEDSLSGGNGSDSLLGGDGNDSLYGEAGDDALDGGAGNDYLNGGAGSDLYRFARGWGQDVINNYDTSIGKTDAIEFAEGIAASDIVATRSGDDLVLSLRGSTDRITVSACFYTDGVSGYKIEEIRFADGTRWDMVQLKQMVQQGTDGNDSLQGYAIADTLSGGAGNDNIRGWAGNDTLDGGAGNDTLVGDEGDDRLTGGAGEDSLSGGNGSDSLLGGDGNDSLYGEAGDDALDGGAGNDYLNGGAGSDLYRFARGWGQDVINNYDTSIGKTDAIEFAEGIAASDIVATRSGDDLVLSLRGSTDRITVSACFYTDGVSGYKIEEIRFADGTRWDMAQLKQMVQQGTEGNDSLQGYAVADTLSGGAGNDNIRGWAGNDTLDGGAGNDTVVGDEGDDALGGGTGDDTLYGENGNDTLLGGEGNDSLYGDAGNDILDGGAGNDYLNGGAGNDTYVFGRDSGRDTVNDYDTTSGNTDVVAFGSNVSMDQLWFRHIGNSLEVSILATDDKLTLSNWYSAGAYHVEQFKTSDSKVLLDSQVDVLVAAMAAFAPPAPGQTSLPPDYQTALNPVIAANWK
ncbi:Cyclolysin [Variovorax sp. PBL-H6]|uniref:calcium-binding protein n=1 Tax=Variovorax sp. PBL-H6 TaxID=434009 RepID=UPI0013177DA5|nr:calcium-binding protein [Variovorax sp. PBL-H6]VTU27028.1 Cyclolysin [Variovorax sp. PBL-H6]